jgi:hypothetical protein
MKPTLAFRLFSAFFILLLILQIATADEFVAVDHQRQTIYHSPQKPGYTCWVNAWVMPDDSVMVSFTQATGPVEGRPRAPKDVRQKLDWPPSGLPTPGYDMTGLDMRNIHLRSTDSGKTWQKVSSDAFKTCMNGVMEGETALPGGAILRGVWGWYLPYNPELPQTGFLERSIDGSKTWGKPEQLLDPSKYTVWPKRIRLLRDGRIIVVGGIAYAPANSKTRQEYSTLCEPLLAVSRDNGKSWSGPIPVVPGKYRGTWGGEECDAAELPTGDLLFVFRRLVPELKKEERWQGILKKSGESWSLGEVGPSIFPHSGHPELLVTREGPILHVATSGISYTTDAGKTWQKLNVPGTAYYPRAVQTRDGKIFVFSHFGSDDPYGQTDQSIAMDQFHLKTMRKN